MHRIYFNNNLKSESNTSENLQQSIPILPIHLHLKCPLSSSLELQNYSILFIKELISGILFQTKLEPNHLPNKLNLL